jgi:hypothetical protein
MTKHTGLKIPLYIGGFVVLFFLFGSGGMWLLSRTERFQNFVKTSLERSASSGLNGTISWKSLRMTSLLSVEVYGLALATKNGASVIAIDHVKGRIELFQLLKRHVVFSKLFAVKADVEFNRQIHPDFIDVFSVKPKSSSPPPPAWTFSIREFFIDSLQARYIDSTGHGTNLACAKISGRLKAASDFTLKTNALALRVSVSRHTLLIDTLYFSMRSDAQGFVCDSFSMNSTHMATHGSFTIPSSDLSPMQADLTARADDFFFKGINAQAWGLGRCDVPIATLRVRGPMAHPTLRVTTRINKTVFNDVALSGARVDIQCDSAGTAAGRIDLDDQALSGSLKFTIRVSGLFSKPVLGDYCVDGDILATNIHDLNRVVIKMPSPDLIRKGAARLSVSASGPSPSQLPAKAHCALALTDITLKNGKTMLEASLKAEINDDTFSLTGTWPQAFSLKASGSVLRDGGSGSGTVEIYDLGPLAMLFNQEATGAIKGDFAIGKFISAPAGRMTVHGTGISWKEMTASALAADISYARTTGFTVNAATAEVKGPLEHALTAVGKPGIRGYLKASLSAQGPVANLSATARLSIDTITRGVPAADLITATISLHDSTVRVNDLMIAKGPARLSGHASFDQSKNTIAADLSINSGVKGPPPGTLSIKGALADSAISGVACTAIDVPVDAARAWFPLLTIPFAKLSMQASLTGKFSNPSVKAAFGLSEIAFVKTDLNPTLRGSVELADHRAIALCTLSVGDACGGPLTMAIHAALMPSFGIDTLAPTPLTMSATGSNVCLKPYFLAVSKDVVLDGFLNADCSVSWRKGEWTPHGAVSIVSNSFAYPALNTYVENVSLIIKPRPNAAFSGVDVFLETGKVRYAGMTLPKTSLRAAFHNNALVIDTANIFFAKGKLFIAGNVPLVPLPQLLTHRDIHFDVRADSIGAVNCNPFISGGRFTAGTINGHILLSAGPSTIKPEGTLSAMGIVFALDDLSPPIGPVQCAIIVSGDSMTIRGGGPWGKGTLTLSGFAAISNNAPVFAKATLIGKNLVIDYLDDSRLRIDSLNAAVSDPMGKWALEGYALLGESNAAYNVPFNQPITVRQKAPPKTSLGLSVRLKIPNCLTMDIKLGSLLSGSASEVKTSLGGTLQVTGTAENPKYAGQVQIDSGSATYLSRVFAIKQGYARLTGAGDINPFIDILATTSVSQVQTTYGADSITITLHISGDLKKPVIALTSNKGFSQLEIISLLTFGSTTFSSAGGAAANSASIISSSLSGVVSKQAQKTLGLEQVQFQGNLFASGSAQANASVSVSKKISPNVTVSYTRGIADTISQQGVISWKLKPFLFLEFESNDKGNAGVDLKYRIKK